MYDIEDFIKRQSIAFSCLTLKAKGYIVKGLTNDPLGYEFEVSTPQGSCLAIKDWRDLADPEQELRNR